MHYVPNLALKSEQVPSRMRGWGVDVDLSTFLVIVLLDLYKSKVLEIENMGDVFGDKESGRDEE